MKDKKANLTAEIRFARKGRFPAGTFGETGFADWTQPVTFAEK